MNKQLSALYGLKYNPFSPEIPTEGLFVSDAIENFCWRIEHQLGEGGFAQVVGDPGTGKSVVLRILAGRLDGFRDVTVGILTRPQASVADFYRELGALFAVPLNPHNRWAGAKTLRERWQSHIEASLYRPVLLVDEAQEMSANVFSELRLLSSVELDSRSILTVILAGDQRLADKLRTPDLLPIGTRIRIRLRAERATPDHLRDTLAHVLDKAGNPNLMTDELLETLCEYATGNYRILMNMANELLAAAVRRKLEQLDEKLYLEVFSSDPKPKRRKSRA